MTKHFDDAQIYHLLDSRMSTELRETIFQRLGFLHDAATGDAEIQAQIKATLDENKLMYEINGLLRDMLFQVLGQRNAAAGKGSRDVVAREAAKNMQDVLDVEGEMLKPVMDYLMGNSSAWVSEYTLNELREVVFQIVMELSENGSYVKNTRAG